MKDQHVLHARIE